MCPTSSGFCVSLPRRRSPVSGVRGRLAGGPGLRCAELTASVPPSQHRVGGTRLRTLSSEGARPTVDSCPQEGLRASGMEFRSTLSRCDVGNDNRER